MAYDPAEDLQRISCPVLAMTGAKALQVDPEHPAARAALAEFPRFEVLTTLRSLLERR